MKIIVANITIDSLIRDLTLSDVVFLKTNKKYLKVKLKKKVYTQDVFGFFLRDFQTCEKNLTTVFFLVLSFNTFSVDQKIDFII